MLSKGLCVQAPPFFFSQWFHRVLPALLQSPAPQGGFDPVPQAAQAALGGLAAATGSQSRAGDFRGHCITFFGHLGLAWRSPIGCPLPWKRGWHGSAEPALARVGSSCRFPNRPRIVGVEQAGGPEGERCRRPGSARPHSHPTESKGVERRQRVPEHHFVCPQVLT